MKPQALFSAAAFLPAFASAAPSADKRAAKPPAFFLAGDSTTAVQSTGGGGWGNGFLSFLKKPAFGTNYGRNGRTTVDYVSQGHWATVKDAVKSNTANFDVYVTIQVSLTYPLILNIIHPWDLLTLSNSSATTTKSPKRTSPSTSTRQTSATSPRRSRPSAPPPSSSPPSRAAASTRRAS